MKEFKNLKRIATEELEKLDAQYANKSEFTAADAEMYKCLMMALEKQLRIEQIEGEMGYGEEGFSSDGYDMSGRRGRSPSTGRYVSRDDGGQSYADGYSAGYSEAMRMNGYPIRHPW
jgi:hypothetical protein